MPEITAVFGLKIGNIFYSDAISRLIFKRILEIVISISKADTTKKVMIQTKHIEARMQVYAKLNNSFINTKKRKDVNVVSDTYIRERSCFLSLI